MMRKLTAIVDQNNVAFVMVQHLTTNIGTIARDPLILAGGKAIKYGASVICDMRKRSIQESDPISKEEGVKIGFSVTKNHVVTNRFPYLKTEYYGIFGQGTEIYLEAIDLAINQGLLVKSGAFIKIPDKDGNPLVLEDGTKMQWQGTAKFRQYCIDNPDFFNDLKNKIEGKVEHLSDEEVVTAKLENEGNLDDIEDVLEEAAKESKSKKK